jgi:hypothetical protein
MAVTDLSNIDWMSYVDNNPDVFKNWDTAIRGTKNPYADKAAYGQYHYINYGQNEGRVPNPVEVAAIKEQEAAAAAEEAAAAAARQESINKAIDIARRQATGQFSSLGLDPNQYSGKLDTTLNDLLAGLGESADPYAALNGKSIADSIYNQEQTGARTQYTKLANEKIGADYGNKLISSNLLDDTIADILNTQRGSAQEYLDRGQKRGIYNDVGYSAGQKTIGGAADTARSSLSTLGTGVLDKYRTQANTVRDNAFSAASGFDLGTGKFDIDAYLGQGNEIASRAQSNAGGDLRGAVGGTNYFDLSALNNSAGQAQGAVNLRDDDLAFALANRRKQQGAGRGIGSQGAF